MQREDEKFGAKYEFSDEKHGRVGNDKIYFMAEISSPGACDICDKIKLSQDTHFVKI